MKIGIESIEFYIPHYYLDLATLACEQGIDQDKYYIGLGQEKMAVPLQMKMLFLWVRMQL